MDTKNNKEPKGVHKGRQTTTLSNVRGGGSNDPMGKQLGGKVVGVGNNVGDQAKISGIIVW